MIDVVLLPGIIAPAAIRYAPLLRAVGDVHAVAKELEVYAADEPAPNYSIGREVDGVSRAADAAGFDRFHLYGHSGGGAIALAFAAAHPNRLLSLALDEPAVDFLGEGDGEYWLDIRKAASLQEPEATRAFLSLQLAPDEPLPPPPKGPPAGWLRKRPAGIRAFVAAAESHQAEPDRVAAALMKLWSSAR